MEKLRVGFEMANLWTDPPMVIMGVAFGGGAALIGSSVYLAREYELYFAVVPWLVVALWYNLIWMANEPADTAKFVKFNDAKVEKMYAKCRIPISHLYEYYIDGDLEFKGDVLDILDNHRDEFVNYKLSFDMLFFLIRQFIGPMSSSFKSVTATKKEIAAHYDRGNDFFRAFLGPRMVYTSGIYYECPTWTKSKGKAGDMKQISGTSLEEAQDNKMSLICAKMGIKPGDRYLDIGCGWGTLMRHGAREFGASAVGVTLSKEGAAWCNAQIEAEGLTDRAEILCMDYREIPKDRTFDCISAIEMAEHVGIKNFQLFLGNIYNMLEDDGTYLMQVAGLRKGANWQDTQWGLFMSKYIFPGADASTPLNWYVKQCEMAGFEVKHVENIGRHYSHTLHGWYDHWMSNRKLILEGQNAYDGSLCRLWDFFLAWSVVASGQCSATCYQLLCHKNSYEFPRDKFVCEEYAGLHQCKRGRLNGSEVGGQSLTTTIEDLGQWTQTEHSDKETAARFSKKRS